MLRLASDEDVHDGIIRGLRRREPSLDIVRVQEVGLNHTPDTDILEWAANEGRVVITGDVNTMVGFTLDRVRQGQHMPGLLALRESSIGQAIEDILLVAECYTEEEMKACAIVYLPL
jgi:predicted nuclease of predicted toxin-antitoxin system